MKLDKRLSIRLDDETKAALERVARRKVLQPGDVARAAVVEALRDAGELPPAAPAPYAEGSQGEGIHYFPPFFL